MSGSSMDGLDVVYAVLSEVGGKWSAEIEAADCINFPEEWKLKLENIASCSAKDLIQSHADFGHWMGQEINGFIERNALEHKVHFVSSHGHTVFHEPQNQMTFQLGDGASMAAELQLPVISDLRNMDVAFGGQGAPIVPIGEKLLWEGYEYFLNIGGIANISSHSENELKAFDICAANRVLNAVINKEGKEYDASGASAASGSCNEDLLDELNSLDFYKQEAPKSLANEFGLETVLPIIEKSNLSTADKLNTYCEHIAIQIADVLEHKGKMLVSGGGALNDYLMDRITAHAAPKEVELEKADEQTINYKEAIVMALIGAMRWREEENVLSSVTGAKQNSIGGALWMGRN